MYLNYASGGFGYMKYKTEGRGISGAGWTQTPYNDRTCLYVYCEINIRKYKLQ